MAENQSSRRSGGKGSHGSQRSFGGGSRRSNSHG